MSQPPNDPTLDADTKATLDTIADALAKSGRVDLPTQEGRPAQVFVVASVPGSRLAVDVEHTMHRVYDRVPVIVVDRQPDREWGDDLSASVRRLMEEDRRRAHAEFAALFAEPPAPNRAQRRAARRKR